MAQQQNQSSDEMIERRKQFVTTEMAKMKQQFANCEAIFIHNEMSMVQTQQIGELFFVMNSAEYEYQQLFERVKNDMAANQRIIEKNKKILNNLRGQMEDIDMDYTVYTEMNKKRDQDRKKFEHYKVKLAKLREAESKAQNQNVTSGTMAFNRGKNKQHEKLVRNVGKFEQAEHYFQMATKTMDDKISVLMKKLDQLSIFLNIKFFQNITLTYYKTFDDIYAKMANIEGELSDAGYQIQNRPA